MKRKTRILLILFIMIAGGAIFGYYKYNQPHKSVASIATDNVIDAASLFNAFNKSESEANKQYLNKILEVSGTVVNATQSAGGGVEIELKGNEMNGVNCSLAKDHIPTTLPTQGTNIKIKGRCVGFLADVSLTDCVIQQ